MLEDEILREIDVFITDDLELYVSRIICSILLTQFLYFASYLMQFPLKPVYSDSPNIISARIKPEHRVLEINVPYETSLSSNDQKLSGKAQKLISSKLNQYLSMGVGVIRDNQLHITPIQEILQIRPSFKDLEDKFGERVELMSDDEDNNTKSISMQQVTSDINNNRKFLYMIYLTFLLTFHVGSNEEERK